jgi:F-type H+-transporting ATPase subunit b
VVEFDATILIQAFNFVLLLALLNQIFFQPLIRIQTERREAVENARKSAAGRMGELKAQRESYQRKLDNARQAAFERVNARVAEAMAVREQELSRVTAEMDVRMAQAREQIVAQESSLKEALSEQIQPLAQEIFAQLTAPRRAQEASIN